MYICNDCGEVFERPKFVFDEGCGWDDFCPDCGGQDFSEAEECKVCHDVYPIRRMSASGFCDECVAKAIGEFNEKLLELDTDTMKILRDQFDIDLLSM